MHDRARIGARLAELGEPLSLAVTERTGSTNDDARTAAQAGAPDGSAFVTSEQTDGRGRGANRWHSPVAENVYLSVVLRPQMSAKKMSALTLAVGVEVARVADAQLTDPRSKLKWPNDIYVDDRKLGGILVESTLQGNKPPVVVVGVGLNVSTREFPPVLAEVATSLAIAGAQSLDRDRVAAELIAGIREAGRRFATDGLAPYLSELRHRDWLKGRAVEVDGVSGTAEGIDQSGRLLIDGRPISAGTVRIRA